MNTMFDYLDKQVQEAYAMASERYAALGVDTAAALKNMAGVRLSVHCWQGDDVSGFESPGRALGGGLAAIFYDRVFLRAA